MKYSKIFYYLLRCINSYLELLDLVDPCFVLLKHCRQSLWISLQDNQDICKSKTKDTKSYEKHRHQSKSLLPILFIIKRDLRTRRNIFSQGTNNAFFFLPGLLMQYGYLIMCLQSSCAASAISVKPFSITSIKCVAIACLNFNFESDISF